jgi:hypothetical protein
MVGNSCFHFKTVASFSFFVTESCDLVFSASEVLSKSRSGLVSANTLAGLTRFIHESRHTLHETRVVCSRTELNVL